MQSINFKGFRRLKPINDFNAKYEKIQCTQQRTGQQFCEVFITREKKTSHVFNVKQINKARLSMRSELIKKLSKQEVELNQELDHPNFIKMVAAYEDA